MSSHGPPLTVEAGAGWWLEVLGGARGRLAYRRGAPALPCTPTLCAPTPRSLIPNNSQFSPARLPRPPLHPPTCTQPHPRALDRALGAACACTPAAAPPPPRLAPPPPSLAQRPPLAPCPVLPSCHPPASLPTC